MKRVLIVDDETFARNHLASALARRGFEVHQAGTGARGIELYEQLRPEAVLLDIRLPDIDGDAVLGHLRALDPEAVVYLITGYGSLISREDAVRLGARGIVEKPLYVDAIIRLLQSL